MNNLLSNLMSLFRGSNIAQQLQNLGIRTTQDASSIQLQNRAGQQISLNQTTVIIQDTNGNMITLDAAGIYIQSAAAVRIDCSQISLNTAMVKASGVIQCDTIIANNVVGSSYTPGVGNIS